MNKWTLTLLLAAFSTLPAAAQTNNSTSTPKGSTPVVSTQAQHSANRQCPCQKAQPAAQEPGRQQGPNSNHVNAQVERAVVQALTQAACTCTCSCCQREGQPDEPEEPEIPTIFTQEEPLSPRELIEAEEELALIRNRQDDNATFEKYPYLLDPAYRRAQNDTQKGKVRKHYGKDKPGQFTPPYNRGKTWANKVGL